MPMRPFHARRKSEHEKLDKKGEKTVCKNCKKYGHSKKTCKGEFVPIDKPNKLSRKAKQGEAGTSIAKQTSTTKQRNVRQKKDQVPNGYGVYIAHESGNTYVKVIVSL
ncbi:hypothetical protein LguiB_029954 [Lonicera macranthoides]